MVVINLQIRANLEYLEKLYTKQPDFQWYLKLRCVYCSKKGKEWKPVSLSGVLTEPKNNKKVHYHSICPKCSAEGHLAILEKTIEPYRKSDEYLFQSIVIFDCVGVEPIEFDFRDGWCAVGEDSGRMFQFVDLQDREWTDWDVKQCRFVSVSDLEHRFIKMY